MDRLTLAWPRCRVPERQTDPEKPENCSITRHMQALEQHSVRRRSQSVLLFLGSRTGTDSLFLTLCRTESTASVLRKSFSPEVVV